MIILAHNRYRSDVPSGENVVQQRQQKLLEEMGHLVQPWLLESDDLLRQGFMDKMAVALRLPGYDPRRKRFADQLRNWRNAGADLVHLHNPWPLFTYDVALAARDVGLPIVQTLHNYRLIGTNNRVVVQGRLGRPESPQAVLDLARMANHHQAHVNPFYNRALESLWRQEVPQTAISAYICLTNFQRQRVVAAGIPAERTVVLPNFLDHRGPIGVDPGEYALFVGRLDETKGIDRLLSWWPKDGPPLKVVGTGPLMGRLAIHPRVEFLGRRPFSEVQELMAGARFLVMASIWYEGFPLVLVEALAAGTPCLVPNLGGMAEVVTPGLTGEFFPPDDSSEAASAVGRLWDLAPSLRPACRDTYERLYTPTCHLDRLLAIYDSVRQGLPLSLMFPSGSCA